MRANLVAEKFVADVEMTTSFDVSSDKKGTFHRSCRLVV